VATVEIVIENNTHTLECDNGEEHKLKELVQVFKERVEDLRSKMPTASDKTLYMVVGITLLEKVSEASQQELADEGMSQVIDRVTKKIDDVSDKLEKLI
jgi:cell division protein ZapA (FtsZ GTPase activity inhibitor)